MQAAPAQTDKKRTTFFRRAKNTPSNAENPSMPISVEVKKARFSLFKTNGRRSGVVITHEPSVLRKVKRPPTPPTPSSSSDPLSSGSSDESSSSEGTAVSDGGEVTDARNRALDILEGRTSQLDPAPASTTASPRGAGEDATAARAEANRESMETVTTPVPASLLGALSTAVVPSHAQRRSSAGSRQSLTPEGPRASSRLSLVPEDRSVETPTVLEEGSMDEHGLPTYASAAYPSRQATYRFAQSGPFSMTTMGDNAEIPGLGQYRISVGVNVWSPKTAVTVVRRGLGEDGQIVAQIEWGVQTMLTIGNVSRPVKDVITKNMMNGTRVYHVGDIAGTTLQWKMNRTHWKAYIETTLLATFIPNPPRKLAVVPAAHKFLDHLLISTLLLMREKEDAVYSRPTSEYSMVAVMPYM